MNCRSTESGGGQIKKGIGKRRAPSEKTRPKKHQGFLGGLGGVKAIAKQTM